MVQKHRIAILVTGHAGTEENPEGVPAVRSIIKKLNANFEITVYSLFKVGDIREKGVKYRRPGFSGLHLYIRLFTMSSMIFFDHIKQPFHLVHCFASFPLGLAGILAGKILRKPCIISVSAGEASGFSEINFGHRNDKRKWESNLWIWKNASAITGQTEFQIESIYEILSEKQKIQIIPYGVSMKEFPFVDKTLKPPYIFINVASLQIVKDHYTLLKTFEIISDKVEAKLMIIGGDFLSGSVQTFARELGIEEKVQFLGQVPYSKMPEYYRQADFMLHTALFEGQWVAALEAMASGVVVCGTKVGLLSDLGSDYFETAEPKDHRGLAEKIIKLIKSPDKYFQLQSKAFTWASDHDLNWTAAQFKKLYHRVI